MDIKTDLEDYATSQGWGFEYARRDYQNLIDAAAFVSDAVQGYGPGETVIVMDPAAREGTTTDMTFTGNFMILTRSNLDETYDKKVELYIDPLVEIVHGALRSKLTCTYDILTWKSIEVINVFDFNADGLSVSFKVRGY